MTNRIIIVEGAGFVTDTGRSGDCDSDTFYYLAAPHVCNYEIKTVPTEELEYLLEHDDNCVYAAASKLLENDGYSIERQEFNSLWEVL